MMPKSRRKLSSLIEAALNVQSPNVAFLTDIQRSISMHNQDTHRKSSSWYKPSSFVCLRQMYFMRTEAEEDVSMPDYCLVGMADTGSRRHTAIQGVLLYMTETKADWRYIDVANYVALKQKEGKCKSLSVVGKQGAETKLFDDKLFLSFMCDGVLQRVSTGEYFLFEFKNQISFKAANKKSIDAEHIPQITCYCAELDLSKAIVLYESRDNCELFCPPILEVTESMKQGVADKILLCEGYVSKLTPPPMHTDTKPCRWCKYQSACRKAGIT
jgi:hypothetical protein